MSKKYSWGIALLACALAVGWLLGTAVVAKAYSGPVPDEATNFVLLPGGTLDTASGGSPANSRAYSKIAPWPDTQFQTFNTGCYENDVLADTVGCFRVVDVSDPLNPTRIATVEVFDRVNSPRPPLPNDPYWDTHPDLNVWYNDKYNNSLQFSTECGDWAVDGEGNHIGPGWHDTKGKPTCWDKGWITRTHFTAGVSGIFKTPDQLELGPGCAAEVTGGGSTIYWVNSQRLRNAPPKRLGYTGVAFYDLKDPSNPEFLGRIDLPVSRESDGTYVNAGGVHHGFFDGRYAYLGGTEKGYEGAHLVIVDAIDPTHPKIVGRWWVPGQKTPGEDKIRNSTDIDPVTGLEMGWIPHSGFQPVERDTATGLLVKDVSFHWIEVTKIDGKEIAFISYHQAGLVILDVTDKKKPKFLSRFDYITPDFQSNDPLPGAATDYASCQANNPGKVGVACGNSHAGKLVPGTNTLWMADEYFVLPYGHLRFFDVSDLENPQLVSHFLVPETTDPDVTYAERTASTHIGNTWGDVLFLAWYGLGVKAIDFSDVTDPQLIGTYSYTIDNGNGGQATYDVIFDPYGNLAVTDSVDGVRMLRYTGPGAMNAP